MSDHFGVMQCTFFPSKQSTQKPNSHSRLLNQNHGQNTIKLFNKHSLAADWFKRLALQDPNQAFSKLMQKLSDAFENCIPVVKSSNSKAKPNLSLDKDLKTLQKDKRKAYFRFSRLRFLFRNCVQSH